MRQPAGAAVGNVATIPPTQARGRSCCADPFRRNPSPRKRKRIVVTESAPATVIPSCTSQAARARYTTLLLATAWGSGIAQMVECMLTWAKFLQLRLAPGGAVAAGIAAGRPGSAE